MAEVAKHNKPNDLWVVIKGMVYDLSSFYQVHPGVPSHILQGDTSVQTVVFNGKREESKFLISLFELISPLGG